MGEYNVLVMSSASFKSKSSHDNAYFHQLNPSLVVADSSIMYVVTTISSFVDFQKPFWSVFLFIDRNYVVPLLPFPSQENSVKA